MYLHIGGPVVLREEDIIGIFDLEITSQSFRTRRYLNAAERAGEVSYVDIEELPKSFLVTSPRKGMGQTVYVSPLSSATLLRRSQGKMGSHLPFQIHTNRRNTR